MDPECCFLPLTYHIKPPPPSMLSLQKPRPSPTTPHVQDSDKLEPSQLDIAIIITEVRKGTSHELIYKETKWLSLAERHSLNCIKQIVTMSENHSTVPQYLKSIFPIKLKKTKPNSRNAENVVTTKCSIDTCRTTCISHQIWMHEMKKQISTSPKTSSDR